MRAFDLEDQIFGKGLIRKMWNSKSGPSPSSLLEGVASRQRFREIAPEPLASTHRKKASNTDLTDPDSLAM